MLSLQYPGHRVVYAVEDEGKAEAIRRALAELLEARFNIHHPMIQTETEPCADEESLHK